VTALIIARGLADRVAAGGEPLGLTTDPRRVERMLANLIGNAVEHSGRDVRVRTGADGAPWLRRDGRRWPGHPAGASAARLGALLQGRLRAAGAGSGLGLAIALERQAPGRGHPLFE
jgi:nitrogen fixation/metabolism regulation signal transduction histidine kinase